MRSPSIYLFILVCSSFIYSDGEISYDSNYDLYLYLQADTREIGEAMKSAIKLLEMILCHVQSFMPKVGWIVCLSYRNPIYKRKKSMPYPIYKKIILYGCIFASCFPNLPCSKLYLLPKESKGTWIVVVLKKFYSVDS